MSKLADIRERDEKFGPYRMTSTVAHYDRRELLRLYDESQTKLRTAVEALNCLLPGLALDLRYAIDDDDKDALASRVKTVVDALEYVGPLPPGNAPNDAEGV